MHIIDLQEFFKLACEEYPKGADEWEEEYERCLNHEFWKDLTKISDTDVREIVMKFLNKWKCRLPYEKAPELAEKLRELEPKLRPLRNLNIANADLLEVISVGSEKRRILDQIAKVAAPLIELDMGKRRLGFTAASKILHICVPEFFVMGDQNIRYAYGCEENGIGYANFMLWMSWVAKDLIGQAKGGEQEILERYGNKRTLAKLIDQYNFFKHTQTKSSPYQDNM
jgi:hypothetical protein